MFLSIYVNNKLIDNMGTLDDQTEKACLIKGTWFPKSQIKFSGDELHIPGWLWDKKKTDMGIQKMYDRAVQEINKGMIN